MHALRHIMQTHGYISVDWIPEIADIFNVSQAEVRGVISFYHDFRIQPPANHQIRICQAEACQAQGSRKLTREIEEHFQTSIGKSTSDGNVSLDPVYCLGLCSVGPSMQVDDRLVARGTLETVREMLE